MTNIALALYEKLFILRSFFLCLLSSKHPGRALLAQ